MRCVSHNPATGKEQWAYRGGAVMNSTLTIADDTIYFVESRNPEVSPSLPPAASRPRN